MSMTRGKRIVTLYEDLKNARTNWDSHWDEIKRAYMPEKDDVYNSPTTGEKRHQHIVDSTGIHAVELFAAGLHGLLTNPSVEWFEYSSGDPRLDDEDEVRLWIQDATEVTHDILNNTNFQTEMHEVYMDLGGPGTAPMFIEEDDEFDVNFVSFPIWKAVIQENRQGLIDTLLWKKRWSGKQILEKWGKNALKGTELETASEARLLEKNIDIIHAVMPRSFADRKKKGVGSFPFASLHVLQKESKLLEESGFREFPFAVPRWTKLNDETYGRSPGMKALPDVNMLNEMMRTTIRAAQKATDPPLMLPDEGFLLPINSRPNGLNFYRAGTQDMIKPLSNNPRPDIGFDAILRVQNSVEKAFFLPQMSLAKEDKEMTLGEAQIRFEEQLRMMGPVLGRMHFEVLRPILDRVFAILLRKGRFLPIPQALKGRVIKIRYKSQFAKAQRVSEAQNLNRAIDAATPVITVQPEVMDIIDGDKYVKHVLRIHNVPQSVLRTQDEIRDIRSGRLAAEKEDIDKADQSQDAQDLKNVTPLIQGAAR